MSFLRGIGTAMPGLAFQVALQALRAQVATTLPERDDDRAGAAPPESPRPALDVLSLGTDGCELQLVGDEYVHQGQELGRKVVARGWLDDGERPVSPCQLTGGNDGVHGNLGRDEAALRSLEEGLS